MAKCNMVGCDLHDKSMLLRIAVDLGPAVTRPWGTDLKARQAVWCRLRTVESERRSHERIVARNPKHKKIAVVARMRDLAAVLWHEALRAKQAQGAEKVPA